MLAHLAEVLLLWTWKHTNFLLSFRLIEPLNLEKAVDLYQKAAGVFEVRRAEAAWAPSSYFTCSRRLVLCPEWGPPASGCRTAGQSLQTSGSVKKVKHTKADEILFSCNWWLPINPDLLWVCLLNQAGRGCHRSAEGEEHVQRDWELPDVFQGAAAACFDCFLPCY